MKDKPYPDEKKAIEKYKKTKKHKTIPWTKIKKSIPK